MNAIQPTIVFEEVDGKPSPRLGLAAGGTTKRDGVKAFDLAESIVKFEKSEEWLRCEWKCFFPWVEDLDATVPDPDATPKPIASAARVKNLVSLLMELHSRATILTNDLQAVGEEISAFEATHEISPNEVVNDIDRAFDHTAKAFSDIWAAIGDLQRHLALLQSGKLVRPAAA
jgi:hypothetical protein